MCDDGVGVAVELLVGDLSDWGIEEFSEGKLVSEAWSVVSS